MRKGLAGDSPIIPTFAQSQDGVEERWDGNDLPAWARLPMNQRGQALDDVPFARGFARLEVDKGFGVYHGPSQRGPTPPLHLPPRALLSPRRPVAAAPPPPAVAPPWGG